MKRFVFGASVALSLLLGGGLCVTALAAQPIMAEGAGCSGSSVGWTNANQTINVGDTVTWSNCTAGYHDLQSTSGGWCLANGSTSGQAGTPWSYACKFTAPGTYTYWCGIHQSAMKGTITVAGSNPAPSPTPPPPSPTPTPRVTSIPTPAPAQSPAAAPTPAQAQATIPSAAASPSPSEQAVASPVPSDTPSSVPNPPPLGASDSSAGGGSGPLVPIIAVVVVAALAGGSFYLWRQRRGA